MRVLVIDDDCSIRVVIAEWLSFLGIEVETAACAEAAMSVLDNCKEPAAMLVDLMMPGMDGKEFVKEMSRHDQWARIPVIFITADPGSVPAGFRVIGKPIDFALLHNMLRGATGEGEPDRR